jgi:putative addiction module component (TIGR02574 family)
MSTDFDSILTAAQSLPPQDQMRLIDALWDGVPEDADVPLHEDWGPEIERRLAAVAAGKEQTVPWSIVRDAALTRIGHGPAG